MSDILRFACLLLCMTLACRPAQEEIPWVEQLVAANDEVVATYFTRQNQDPEHPDYGGLPNQYEIYNPGSGTAIIQRMVAAYLSPTSSYYRDPKALDAAELAMDFLLRKQHDDGTIDLLTTNFHSTPDLGFVGEPLALSYKVLSRDNTTVTASLRKKIKQFMDRAAHALSIGGIHTPNHRWVVSMALARWNELFPSEKYVRRIEEWLNEGIDIDADGQYTERSTTVYSPSTNNWLITIARLLDKPALLDHVRHNLEMSIYYLHSNGEMVTEASRRQDQYRPGKPTRYYYAYRYMGIHDQNGRFGAMTKIIERQGAKSVSGYLILHLEDPSLTQEPPISQLDTSYVKFFPHSELVRIRRGERDATILSKNPAVLTFHKGEAVLQAVRMADAFFGKGQL